MSLSLFKALRVDTTPCIAFIGAGGKTTAMFQLARELNQPVIVTATSHLGAWQTGLADKHIMTETPAPIEELEHGLSGITLVTGKMDGDRTKPINEGMLNWLYQFCGYHSIPLLIEADGARQKPLKAWAEHEPPIPLFVEQVVEVVGLSGIGKMVDEENVHRPELFSNLSGLKIGDIVSPKSVIDILCHEDSGQKNIPVNARRALLLNQADTTELQSIAHGMSHALLSKFGSVVVASLKQGQLFAVHEPIAGIILAAGESTRFGQPKQLLDWKGQPFVRVVAKTTLQAGLSPVLVVTGSNAEKVESAVRDLPIKIVRNDEWREGQASSIRAGVRSLTQPPPSLRDTSPKSIGFGGEWVGACIFLLVDQPQMTTTVLNALIENHATQIQPILAPMVQDQRANPVLFDRVTFKDLLELTGDVGGRGIFHKHRVDYLPWHDDRLLLDVDTPEMYNRLISDDTL